MAPNGKIVLVVEDDPDMREVVAELLTLDGYRVQVAATAQEGLDAVKGQPPDLILLDMVMPGMNGEQFLKHLRANPSWQEIPVVATTALSMRKLPTSAVALLPKPFERHALSELVSTHVRANGRPRK